MKYELLETNQNGLKIFARIDEDGMCRVTCLESDPAYQEWLNPTAHLTESVTKAK